MGKIIKAKKTADKPFLVRVQYIEKNGKVNELSKIVHAFDNLDAYNLVVNEVLETKNVSVVSVLSVVEVEIKKEDK